MRTRWAALAVAAAGAAIAWSWWLQREPPLPDIGGMWQLRPDPPRPAWAKPLQRPLGDELTITASTIAWRSASGPVERPYALSWVGGALSLAIDLDGDGQPEQLPCSWLPDGEAPTFGLGQTGWSGWWTRKAAP